MMEDLLILGGFASLFLFIFIYLIVSIVKSCNAKQKARNEINEEIMRRGREAQEAESKRYARATLAKQDADRKAELLEQAAKNQPPRTYTYADKKPVAQTVTKQDDSFVDNMVTAMVINNIMSSHSDTPRSSTRNDDVPYKDTSPSYRDESPSSSWGSSSSSDSSSSWSSSDSSSSPSSDW